MLTIRRLHVGTAGEPEGEGVFVEYNGLCALPADRRRSATGDGFFPRASTYYRVNPRSAIAFLNAENAGFAEPSLRRRP
jgi:hypothetical protein